MSKETNLTESMNNGLKPLVSVIIPSGRPEMVDKTIRLVEQQDIPATDIEIIVVSPSDDRRRDTTDNRVRTANVPRLYPPGKMRNIGAAAARGELLAFIDDDCQPPENWISGLAIVLQRDDRTAAVGCRVVGIPNSFWVRCADYSLFSAYQLHKGKKIPLGSAAVLVRRDAFQSAGGFDQELLASEDWDFSLKLIARNWVCRFDPSIEVNHEHGCVSYLKILQKAYNYGKRSRLVVQKRHSEQMSALAKLSLAMRSPWLYWLLILPYALIVSTAQSLDFMGADKRIPLYFPVILSSRISYHCGVLVGLIDDADKRS